jgi:hypothetical protein
MKKVLKSTLQLQETGFCDQAFSICTKRFSQPTYFHMETTRENPKFSIFTTIESVMSMRIRMEGRVYKYDHFSVSIIRVKC